MKRGETWLRCAVPELSVTISAATLTRFLVGVLTFSADASGDGSVDLVGTVVERSVDLVGAVVVGALTLLMPSLVGVLTSWSLI